MKKGAMAVGLILVLLLVTLAGAEPVRKQVYYNKKVSLGLGTKPVRFSLWEVETGGTVDPNRVWFEEKPIAGSNVKTYLGDVNPLDGVDFSRQLWLQIEKKDRDDNYIVVGPRERFSPDAYALWSGTADVAITAVTSETVTELPDNSVSAVKIQAGAVTGDKIAYDAVTGSKINSSTTINVAGVNSTGAITGPNVTSGNNPGHIHTGYAASSHTHPGSDITGNISGSQITDNSITGAKINSSTNLTVSALTSTGAINGPNVTSGTDPGHSHTGASVPSGFFIMGPTPTAPAGYSYTGAMMDFRWVTKSPMHIGRYYIAAATVNGKVYVIGGYNGANLANNEEYDPLTNTWTTKADMPTARQGLAVATVNGKIYAIGGYSNSGRSAKNEEYDPATNTWTTKADMPTARNGLAATVVNGKIYVIGGGGFPGALIKNEEYDPTTDTWSTKADMPTGRAGLAVATANGKVYALGGDNNTSPLTTNEEYNPADGPNGTWTAKLDMPTGRYGLATAVVNGKVYAIGGYNLGDLAKNEEYDPVTNTWSTMANMPTARYLLAAAAANNKIYAIGGINNGYTLSTTEEFAPDNIFYIYRKD